MPGSGLAVSLYTTANQSGKDSCAQRGIGSGMLAGMGTGGPVQRSLGYGSGSLADG